MDPVVDSWRAIDGRAMHAEDLVLFPKYCASTDLLGLQEQWSTGITLQLDRNLGDRWTWQRATAETVDLGVDQSCL